MATYLRVKQLLTELLNTNQEVDEDCDISYNSEKLTCTIFDNAFLKDSFDKLENYAQSGAILCSPWSYEIAMQTYYIGRFSEETSNLSDKINGLEYTLGIPSAEYSLSILSSLADKLDAENISLPTELRQKTRYSIQFYNDNSFTPEKRLAYILRLVTLKITSSLPHDSDNFQEFASSYIFLWMYKHSLPIHKCPELTSLYPSLESRHYVRSRNTDIDTPPKRIINSEILDYYTLAMESRDPFTSYISYYHVIEHYFDAVFRKKLTNDIREKITHPDFSYKDEDMLYDLAKFIKKHMNSDDDSGKGNELESLKYVLAEYVPIVELKRQIQSLDNDAVAYYQSQSVPFTSSSKSNTKIGWNDSQGIYSNIAARVYNTRNALVHAKSEQSENQYRPYRHRKYLIREIPLIRSIAEIIIINSSKLI